MSPGENLYFIALIPSEEICNEITTFKQDFSNRFSSYAALKVMPHITLKAPFMLPYSKHLKLLEWFQKLYVQRNPFQIELRDFGAFHNIHSPVVFVNPVMNLPLYALQKEIIRSFRIAYPQIGVLDIELKFKPHMTIAYRDLDPEIFIKAWEEYKVKKYQAVFEVKGFHLLQHDRKRWNIIETYFLDI